MKQKIGIRRETLNFCVLIQNNMSMAWTLNFISQQYGMTEDIPKAQAVTCFSFWTNVKVYEILQFSCFLHLVTTDEPRMTMDDFRI